MQVPETHCWVPVQGLPQAPQAVFVQTPPPQLVVPAGQPLHDDAGAGLAGVVEQRDLARA